MYEIVHATVAQMVEQFTRNDQVSGSIPLGGSIFFTSISSTSHPIPHIFKTVESEQIMANSAQFVP